MCTGQRDNPSKSLYQCCGRAVALSFGAKSIDIMVTGMYYLSGGYLPGGNYVQIIFARLLFST